MISGSVLSFVKPFILSIGLLLFQAHIGFAGQGPSLRGPGAIVDSLHIEPEDPSSLKLLREMGITPGEPYSAPEIKKGIEALYKTGAFRDIRAEALSSSDGISLTFYLTHRKILEWIELKGNHVLKDGPLLEALEGAGVEVGTELTDKAIGRGLVEIQGLYQEAGYFRARPVPHFQPGTDPDTIRLEIYLSERERTIIRKVRFEGQQELSHMALYLRIRYRAGEYYSRSRLQSDRKRLFSLYEEKGYLKATIAPPEVHYIQQTNEVDIVYFISASNKIRLRFEGLAPLSLGYFDWEKDTDRLRALVLIREEQNDGEEVLEQSVRRMKSLYHNRGYPEAKVSFHKEILPSDGSAEITFLIEAGPRVRLGKIQFEGNRGLPTKRLLKGLSLRRGGYYLEERLDKETENLLRLYRKEGFLEAKIQVQLQWNTKRNRVALLFQVEEGLQTRVSEISFTGLSTFSEEHLRGRLLLKEGAPYKEEVLKEDQKILLRRYKKDGYLQAELKTEVEIFEDNRQANIFYHLTEGYQTRVGEVILKGNVSTENFILLRELLIHTGDPLDFDRVLENQKRLYRLGLFSEVRFEPRDTPDPKVKNLLLNVKERRAGAVEFGIGFADYERLRGFLGMSHRNLFGTGRFVGLRAEASNVKQRYSLDYKEPWIFSRDMDGRLGFAFERSDKLSFNRETFSISVGLVKNFSDRLTGKLVYQLEQNVVSNVSETIDFDPREGRFNIGSMNPSLIYDTRDDLFNPTRGSVVKLTLRDAAKILGSKFQFVKGTAQMTQFLPLQKRLVLAFSVRGGAAYEFGESDTVPLPEKFLAGGRNTVRGYDQDKLGIPGVTIIDGKPQGGNALLVFNEELRINLPASIGIVLFLDHGNVWQTVKSVRIDQIKSTTGVGLRYNTPVGPLRLDYGYKLQPEEGEDRWALHFTLGHAF